MFRVLQSLPSKFYRGLYGGVFQVQQGQATTDSNWRRHCQDGLGMWPPPTPALGASLHTSKWYGAAGDQGEEQREEWEKSFKQRLEWDSFKRSSYAQEAVGWGSIFVLGLQLGRYFSTAPPSDADRRHLDGGTLSSFAHVLRGYPSLKHMSSTRSILLEGNKERSRPQYNSNPSSSKAGSDESVIWEFEGGIPSHTLLQEPIPTTPSKPASSKPSVSRRPSDHSTVHSLSYQSRSSTSLYSSSSSSLSLGNGYIHASSTPIQALSPQDDTLAGAEAKATQVDPSSARDGKVTGAGDIAVTLNHVTQQCWGQVNNIIGGHLAAEGKEEKAAEHFRLASDAGYSKGQYNLGMCSELGKGVPQDDVKAATYFTFAARQGHPYAQYKLGMYHLEGRGNLKQCQKRALRHIIQAAHGGVIQAQTYLGMYYMSSEEEDSKKAVMYLKAAALEKDPEAEYHLGLCYEFGWGVEVNTAKAAKLYHSAARRNHAQALFALGLFYQQGLGGLPENECKVRELFKRASMLGFDKAMEKLGEMDSEDDTSGSFYSSSSTSLSGASNCSLDSTWSLSESNTGLSPQQLDVAPPAELHERAIHASCSAPQLTSRHIASPNRDSGVCDGDDAQPKSLLHSLSCLKLVFSRLHPWWSISDGFAGRSCTLPSGNRAAADTHYPFANHRIDRESSHSHSVPNVQFQLGGGEEEENGAINWYEPIDVLPQRRLVPFRLSAKVI